MLNIGCQICTCTGWCCHAQTHTWFHYLTAYFPFELGSRVNLQHLLQVNIIGCPSAQGDGDGGVPWGHCGVQYGRCWRRVQLPLALVPLPLPHWSGGGRHNVYFDIFHIKLEMFICRTSCIFLFCETGVWSHNYFSWLNHIVFLNYFLGSYRIS